MTDSPAENSPTAEGPDPGGTGSDQTAGLLGGDGSPPSASWTDPVEEQGARFAREADDDEQTSRPAGDPATDDLTPDFLAPDVLAPGSPPTTAS